MKIYFTILLFSIMHGVSAQFIVEGKLIDNKSKKPMNNASLELKHIKNNQIIRTSTLSHDGIFTFILKDTGEFLLTVHDFDNQNSYQYYFTKDTSILIKYERHCAYDSSLKNKKCPICHHKKNTIPILYGLIINTNKKPSKKLEEDKYYAGGCNISSCQPHWYCKKDKYTF